MSFDDYAIRCEGLGKRYLVPQRRSSAGMLGRLQQHLKEYTSIGRNTCDDYFWALKDVSFEVKPGEVLGIVGRNGSGKSTLLKILSGVTLPTTGRAELRGKVGSLLEVGTGFHPDMSGRENVFMAGALLGLRQSEVRAKLDQIIDFAGIERFIDTPVKRYSSGMYVRLAYSVASMLRSDILILDEVMAVGDAEFREKSQQNIEQMSRDGRTILYVSHNARSVRSLCKTGIVLDKGEIKFRGSAADAVANYMRAIHHLDTREELEKTSQPFHDISSSPRLVGKTQHLRWVSTHAADGTPTTKFTTGRPLVVRIGYEGLDTGHRYFSILVMNDFGERVATLHSTHDNLAGSSLPASGTVECRTDDLRLGEGTYWLMIDSGTYGGSRANMTSQECVPSAAKIDVDLDNFVAGIGVDAYQGAALKSVWRGVG